MPVCKCCGRKWSWKGTMKKLFAPKQKFICPYCQKEQFIEKSARLKISLLCIIPIIVLVPLLSFNVPILYIILIEFVFCLGVSLLMPFFCELSDRNEPLW